ncbi:MAG: hypothetical protein R3F33_08385 [Planctomycetota bacterium]
MRRLNIALPLAALLAVPVLAAWLPREVVTQGPVSADECSTLRWSCTQDLQCLAYQHYLEGEDPSYVEQLPRIQSAETRYFRDWIQAVDAGGVVRMRRLVDRADIKAQFRMDDPRQEPVTLELRSPLAGPQVSVQFERIGAGPEFGQHFDRNAASEESLAGLRADWSLTLAGGEHADGEEFEVSLAAWKSLVSPGGTFDYQPVERAMPGLERLLQSGTGGELQDLWSGPQLKGKATGVWRRDGEGRRRLEVNLQLENSVDRLALARAYRTAPERAAGLQVERAEVSWGFTGQASLLLRPETNQVERWKVEGQQTITAHLVSRLPDQPQGHEISEFRGLLVLEGLRSKTVQPDKAPAWDVPPMPGAEVQGGPAEDGEQGR